jgi:hypothetical protein
VRFELKSFSCDVDVFNKGNDLLVRFYDSSKEQSEEEIINLIIVNPGYGYIFLKYKGDSSGLLGGFLDEEVFSSDEMVEAAISFVEDLSPLSKSVYVPYHVDRVSLTSYVEYNGEY